jgi:hypothetical protein
MSVGIKFVFSFLAALALFISSFALAGETKEEQCTSIISEGTAALVARDWVNLERLGNKRLATCKGVYDSRFSSGGYLDIATANNALGERKSALVAAESCISTFYRNANCHVEKSAALVKLVEKEEARKALDIAYKVTTHELKQAEQDIRGATNPLEKKLFEARKTNCESLLEYIEALRTLQELTAVPDISLAPELSKRDP